MSALGEILSRHRVGLTDDEVVAELDAALGAAADPGATPLTAAETAYLRSHGGSLASSVLDGWSPAAARAAQGRAIVRRVADTLASSVSIAEAAALLDVDRSRISHLLARRMLWAFSLGSSRRIPRWQITAAGERLPGLERIVPAIPASIHPLALDAFIHAPQRELDGLTPGLHLASGGDAETVADLLRDLDRW